MTGISGGTVSASLEALPTPEEPTGAALCPPSSAVSFRKDPRVRSDGRCAVCGNERQMPRNRQKGIDPTVYMRDPFCSAVCAHAYHDVVLASRVSEGQGRPLGYTPRLGQGKSA